MLLPARPRPRPRPCTQLQPPSDSGAAVCAMPAEASCATAPLGGPSGASRVLSPPLKLTPCPPPLVPLHTPPCPPPTLLLPGEQFAASFGFFPRECFIKPLTGPMSEEHDTPHEDPPGDSSSQRDPTAEDPTAALLTTLPTQPTPPPLSLLPLLPLPPTTQPLTPPLLTPPLPPLIPLAVAVVTTRLAN